MCDFISWFSVARVLCGELLNGYFVLIHNFRYIIHANVCAVYLIVLLTITSHFQRILKDTNLISSTPAKSVCVCVCVYVLEGWGGDKVHLFT